MFCYFFVANISGLCYNRFMVRKRKEEKEMNKRITKEVLEQTVTCSKCGKVQKAKDMRFKGIEDGFGKMDFDLALFNCECRSTQSVRIPRESK